jgi:hypothetical protein
MKEESNPNSKYFRVLEKIIATRIEHGITQLNIGNITIQENTSYGDVASTIEHLNTNITIDADKYMYHGQTIHRLAHEYYERNHNNKL